MAKTWFITGASSGLGRSMTEALLARGDRVAATVRRPDALADLSARHGGDLWVGVLDLTDTSAIRHTVDAAWTALDRIDVVVSNAAYGRFAAAEEAGDEQVRHQIDTNLVGSIQVIRAALPHLRGQGDGQILQVSSTGGQFAFPSFSLYHATKWGIEGFCEAVAKEVSPPTAEPRRTTYGWRWRTGPARSLATRRRWSGRSSTVPMAAPGRSVSRSGAIPTGSCGTCWRSGSWRSKRRRRSPFRRTANHDPGWMRPAWLAGRQHPFPGCEA